MSNGSTDRISLKKFLIVAFVAVSCSAVAYAAFDLVSKIPLRCLLATGLGAIILVTFLRPCNVQPTTTISLLALCVSYAALTHNITEWKATNEAKRPYFMIVESSIRKVSEEGDQMTYTMEIPFQNTGQRNAVRGKVRFIAIPANDTSKEYIHPDVIEFPNEIPPNIWGAWKNDNISVKKDASDQIFGFVVVYEDPVLKKCFSQNFVAIWQKRNGEFRNSLNFLLDKIPDEAINRVKSFELEVLKESCSALPKTPPNNVVTKLSPKPSQPPKGAQLELKNIFALFYAVFFGSMLGSMSGFQLFHWGKLDQKPIFLRLLFGLILFNALPIIWFSYLFISLPHQTTQSDWVAALLASLMSLSVWAFYRLYHALLSLGGLRRLLYPSSADESNQANKAEMRNRIEYIPLGFKPLLFQLLSVIIYLMMGVIPLLVL